MYFAIKVEKQTVQGSLMPLSTTGHLYVVTVCCQHSRNHVLLPCASKQKISTNKEDVLATKGSSQGNKQLFGSQQRKQKNSHTLWHKTKLFTN
jgi:hypothetical protein